ncbi:MAG: DUF4920 domain-containing protein [Chitinophagaceae bacterium]|nr:DUF4920 domain-containing protein [Chitinophagaceae bacterium]
MKKIIFSAVLIAAGYLVNAQPPKVPANKGDHFGQQTTAENAISVEQLYTNLQAAPSKEVPVKLKGVVTEVCQMEGCWIRVKSPEGSMMVKMKDHKFTVPVILNGKTIVIDGTAEEKLTTVEQLRHFAEDAGKSKDEIAKITQPKKEVIVQAKGILVL